MNPPANHYHMNVSGGIGGPGGMSERGIGGNGGVGQGPTLHYNVSATHFTVNNLSTEALEKLGYVAAANIDAQSPEGCLKHTRVDLLNELQAWGRDPNSPRIFWLDGMAGTGKSAITRSFCHMLREDKQLGGSFFCLRGDASRSNPKNILPTLAIQLASQDAAYKSALLAALGTGIFSDANLKIQVDNLLEKPLCSAHGSGPPTLVLVIDALDELDDEDATKDLLRRLVSAVPRLPIKLFVTSRPERHIRPHFNTQADLRRVIRLHDIEDNTVTADISLYLTNCLAGIRAEHSPMLPPEWASLADIKALTNRAGKLFIYASTVVKYISENPTDRLRTLINMKVDTKGPLTKPLDDVYRHILSDAMDTDRRERDEIVLMKQILATVLTVSQPLSVASLGGLLEVPAQRVRAMLDRLHAVIHVPADNDGVLTTFHASFGDFLTTTGRVSGEMLINSSATHTALFSNCLRVMGSELHFNVSKCPTSYFPNTHHELTIPALLQYVCLYWPHHIVAASAAEASDVEVFVTSSHLNSLQDVFFPNFLFWVEVLSAMNKASVASSLIMMALTAKCFARAPLYMTEFLGDANEFVVSSMEAIETSVAHIYLSALPCLRPTSKVAQAFWPKFNCVPRLHLAGIQRRREVTLILQGHDDGVNCIAISADGVHIASGSDDKMIRVWDARTGKAITEPIQGHTERVWSVAFSPSGAHIVSGSDDKTICVWDVRTGKAIMEPIRGHTDSVLSVMFSPDGARITSGSDDKTIRVWDVRTGKAVMKPIQHTDSVLSVVFSPDGAHIASGSDDKMIHVWDARTGKAVTKPIQGHISSVWSVAFSPNGAHIVSGSHDKTIRVWDARTGKAVMEPIRGHTSSVSSVVFSPDGARIASGSHDKSIRVWDARMGEAIMEPIRGHTSSVWSVAFSPDGTHIVSGSDDKTIRVWDTRMGKAVTEPIKHTSSVLSTIFSPDGAHIASGSDDKTICVWDARTGEAVTGPIKHTSSVLSVAFSPDGVHIASGSDDWTICVWDMRTGKAVIEPIRGHTDSVWSVVFSPDGARIASSSVDRTIRVWDARTGEAVMGPIQHTSSVLSVAFSPDGAYIASGSWDHMVCVWDARTGEAVTEPIQGHTSSVRSVAFSPDGARIVSGSSDHTICVWDVMTGEAVMEPIQGHTSSVRSVVFSPDGAHIMSGSLDHTICVWDARTGEAVMEPIQGHASSVRSVVFSPDGAHIASSSDDKMIRVWNVRTGVTTVDKFSPLTMGLSIGPITLPHRQESWIRGPSQELVMWVPPEYRDCLQLPPRFIVIGSARVVVDMSRFVHGALLPSLQQAHYTPESFDSLTPVLQPPFAVCARGNHPRRLDFGPCRKTLPDQYLQLLLGPWPNAPSDSESTLMASVILLTLYNFALLVGLLQFARSYWGTSHQPRNGPRRCYYLWFEDAPAHAQYPPPSYFPRPPSYRDEDPFSNDHALALAHALAAAAVLMLYQHCLAAQKQCVAAARVILATMGGGTGPAHRLGGEAAYPTVSAQRRGHLYLEHDDSEPPSLYNPEDASTTQLKAYRSYMLGDEYLGIYGFGLWGISHDGLNTVQLSGAISGCFFDVSCWFKG
ncbi:WD40-repeat-containing domain protein [Mycena vulgaris]|nr:WD40-repeat-containing domain protein [Mycena vulgaris]